MSKIQNEDDRVFSFILIIAATFATYNMLYHFSKYLNIYSFIDVGLDLKIPYEPPSLISGFINLFFIFIFLLLSFYFSIDKVDRKIKNIKYCIKKNYKRIICYYFIGVFLLVFTVPFVIPILRGWR